jgi:hypothetical protein
MSSILPVRSAVRMDSSRGELGPRHFCCSIFIVRDSSTSVGMTE